MKQKWNAVFVDDVMVYESKSHGVLLYSLLAYKGMFWE